MNDRAKELIQDALPAYEIANELGSGAFGVVYEARHTQLGRQVAIKQLPQSYAENDEVRERFVAEAQMVASLEHPHIVPVYDFVESEGSRFLIMERCEGSVGDRFKSEGIVTDEACAAVLACLAALDFAHAKGLLHRDVKPENLMYDTKGVVKLGDFGIARDLGADTRRTATGMIVGTPAYMSPEQCRGDDLTPASDVYSVAMMGYELLTGALPFPNSDSVNGLLAHHLVTEPTPLLTTRPELPGAVGEVIDRALVKDLNVRYSTAIEFATALARACVTAFGSGWLRRRRFVLHWPEIIAETERPDSNSPRTGTIMVKAGDVPHAVVSADEALEPTAQLAPEPVAVVGAADAPTLPPDLESSSPAPPVPVSPAPTPAHQPNAVAQVAQPVAAPAVKRNGPNWPLFGGVAAAIAAVIIGVIIFAGGGSGDSGITVTQPDAATSVPENDDATDSNPRTDTAADEPANVATPEPAQDEPTPEPAQEPTPEAVAEPTIPTGLQDPSTRDEAGEDQPVIFGSNGNPIMNFLPLEFDDTIADSPWSPTPCPIEQPVVACLFGAVSPDEETGELQAAWFTLGFTPELEPVGYHIHFYLPELVDGDETKAGTATPGGSFRQWDGPWPATSFGGDNGRTLYTLADMRQAGSTTLCVIVATPDNETIPGSGNCAPVPPVDDDTAYRQVVDRLEGQWVGSCTDGALVIAPADWRWYSMTEYSPVELAQEIRPTAVAETTELFEQVVAEGGVIWAEGPVESDFIVNFSMSIIPGNFGLNDTPGEVAETLGQLGIDTSNGSVARLSGRRLLFAQEDLGDGIGSATFIAPDSGYAVQLTFTGPGGLGLSQLAEQIAYTLQGC